MSSADTSANARSNADVVKLRKQLAIKRGAAQRLLKEHTRYKEEAEAQQRATDAVAASAADDSEKRYQLRLLEEANKMIPESQRLLGRAVVDLHEVVVLAKSEPALNEDEELRRAEEILEEANV